MGKKQDTTTTRGAEADDARSDLDRLLDVKKARRRSVAIATDPDQHAALMRAAQQTVDATVAHSQETDPAQKRILKQRRDTAKQLVDKLRSEIETVSFVFESIGAEASEALLQQHKPTPAAQKRYAEEHPGDYLLFDPDTYPPARIAACLVEIRYPDGHVSTAGMDAETVRRLWSSRQWTTADRQQLFEAAREVDTQFSQVALDALGKG